MYGFLLQDWTTIRLAGSASTNSIIQSEAQWVSLQPYQDVVFWLDCREITLGTNATGILCDFETAPLKDDNLFKPMVTGVTLTGASPSSSPQVTKVLLASATVPLARWVRWKLTVQFSTQPTTVSDITFRIAAAANAVSSLA